MVTEINSYLPNWQQCSIGLDNGLAPNRRQAIIWTNADPIHWRIYAALGGDEFNCVAVQPIDSLIQYRQLGHAFSAYMIWWLYSYIKFKMKYILSIIFMQYFGLCVIR